MSIYAFGDIHGSNDKLIALLDTINPKKSDTLIFLGDMIDRGTNSKGVLDTIMTYETICQVITLLGNHEQMLLDAYLDFTNPDMLDFWLRYGGDNTLWSFGLTDDLHGLLKIPHHYISWLKSRHQYFETDKFIFTHATPKPNLALKQQGEIGLRWRPLYHHDMPHISGKTIVCGHTTQKDGRVYQHQGLICIDTYAYADGFLTALQIPDDSDDLVVWQTNKKLSTKKSLLRLL